MVVGTTYKQDPLFKTVDALQLALSLEVVTLTIIQDTILGCESNCWSQISLSTTGVPAPNSYKLTSAGILFF